MRQTISLSITLALFWLANSGHYNALLLSLGALSVIFVVYLAYRMDVLDHETQPLMQLTTKLPSYYTWLIKEIILSNIKVVKHVWLGQETIKPALKTIKSNQTTDVGRVIYANSITLTPGTVAIDLNDDEILVHALMQEDIEALDEGEMDRRICRLEKS
ncbi:Na+/H+ antiporter subunit E [Marinicella sp. S1101]|uniref:Na+/H+ antiporter subunit E n=1 Tax=Marinicella marina TaxID=2996016 RepID=UPI002260E732|nr:Na+/H+ antiporter subunit E [Marinicella marina]MCX7555060.1 Na+/H+ antiporter subunit E [Marinicella marina]MDJ1141368.1 Na+/H+ antiporter subunit E [Marinicella marina]